MLSREPPARKHEQQEPIWLTGDKSSDFSNGLSDRLRTRGAACSPRQTHISIYMKRERESERERERARRQGECVAAALKKVVQMERGGRKMPSRWKRRGEKKELLR